VHVRQIRIENIRGFGSVDIELTRPGGGLAGWTVLAGRNGSGKSTFLKAIALALAGPDAARALQETFSSWIRVGRNQASVIAWLDVSNERDYDTLDFPDNGSIGWGLSWKQSEPGREPKLSGLLNETIADLEIGGPWEDNTSGWFAAGYGPYRRLSGHAADAQRLMSGPVNIARVVSLFREDASLVEGTVWLREMYLRRLEGNDSAAEVEKGLLRLLNDGLFPGDIRLEGIDSAGLRVRTPSAQLPLTELSDGYRTVAALVIDIVQYLYLAFGELNINEDRCPSIPHEGVVLIDEVDLHLHVSWQKGIGFWLKRHFPNIQFIVTTHSPFVCQAADPRGLIRLPAPGEDRQVEHVSEDLYNTVVNGSADDAVLTELFGLDTPYSAESEKLRDEVARIEAGLQTGDAKPQDEQRLEELRSRLPQTPGANIEQLLRKLTADA
jgi:energy-coupling factor transporter ATP-binding protein EcfA2